MIKRNKNNIKSFNKDILFIPFLKYIWYSKLIKKYQNMNDGNYYLLASDYAKMLLNLKQYYLLDLIIQIDGYEPIDLETGKYLESLVFSKDKILAMHRTHAYQDDNEEIKDTDLIQKIFNNGLINNGDLNSSGAMRKINELYKTMTFNYSKRYSGIINFFLELKSSYKGSNVAVLAQFDPNLVDMDGEFTCDPSEIMNIQDNLQYIKNDYLIGIVNKENDRLVFHSKEDILGKEKNR